MRTVLFLTYHGVGHFNASFQMARTLQTQYRVVFSGLDLFRNYVEGQGFAYRSVATVPFGLGLEGWLNRVQKKTPVYFYSLRDRWTDRLYYCREKELLEVTREVHPELILLDYMQSTDFIVLYPYAVKNKVRIGFVQTMLPQRVIKNYPPLNSLVSPEDKTGVAKANRLIRTKRFFQQLGSCLLFLGWNNHAIVKRRVKKNAIDQRYYSDDITPYSVPFDNIDEFLLLPSEFDFKRTSQPTNEHYVGFMPDEKRVEKFDGEYERLLVRIKANKYPVIYCSFGTITPVQASAVDAFLNRLIDQLSHKSYFLVISMPNSGELMKDAEFPDNVWCLNAAPQLDMLSRSNLFISHGGLNSVKESVYAGVPLLIYPLDSRLDQKGNAARVRHHGIGLIGDLRSDSGPIIQKKVDGLLSNGSYRKEMERLKAIDKTYSSERFLEQINRMKPLN